MLTVACSGIQGSNDYPQSVVDDPEVWVVVTEPAFEPFTFVDAAGEIAGFDADLMRHLCERLGLGLEFVSIPFDGIVPMLEAGTADVAISAITITSERSESIDFSRPYFKSGLAIAVQSAEQDIHSLADLAGRKVAAKLGTTGADVANQIPDVQIIFFDSTALALQDLANGNVDAVINDAPATLGMMAQGKASGVKLVGDPLTEEWYGIALPPNSANLPFVNDAIAEMLADGTYENIFRRWFGTAPMPELPETIGLSTTGQS